MSRRFYTDPADWTFGFRDMDDAALAKALAAVEYAARLRVGAGLQWRELVAKRTAARAETQRRMIASTEVR